MSEELNNKLLIKGCSKRDRNIMAQLFKKFGPKVKGMAYRYARDTFDADDLVQESFIQIFIKIHQVRNPDALESWIRHVAISTMIGYYKKHVPFSHDLPELPEEQIDQIAFSPDQILKLIRNLPDGYRMVFNLRVFEEYTHQEISDMLGISISTSRSQLTKAKKYLLKKLSACQSKT